MLARCRPLLFAALLLLPLSSASAQEPAEWDVDRLELLLPRHETEAERLRWLGREHEMPQVDLRDNPPAGPARNCAEWEPVTGVLIRYPLGLPYNLLRDMDDHLTLHVIVSSSYLNSATTNLANNGVDMEQVDFLVRDNDSIWTRDYGPWFIFDAADQIGIVNHTYNRPWRPNDNLIPLYLGQELGIPVYSHSMYHTGGNYMTDGAHFSSSTRLVYDEALSDNGMTATEVNALMEEYYGVQNYQVLDYIESGGIHHIDTWAKFLDEENVLLKEVWPTHHTYTTLEQRATLLASLRSSTGRNYQGHRIYCYEFSYNAPASYTNSIILNDRIYVPLFGNTTYDEAALDTYRQAAPGYQVAGYYYSGFLSDDALHCRTKGVMDAGMLRIAHVPVLAEQTGAVSVTADIKAHSGAELAAAAVHYRHDQGDWQTAGLVHQEGSTYTGVIPAPAAAATCDYYLAVSDASGRTEGMPRTQPAAFYTFTHQPQVSPAMSLPGAGAALHANYPNPFNPATTFSFELKYPGPALLTVIDARGRLVRTLVRGEQTAGTHEVVWDGRDDGGRQVASGVYYYRLQAAGLQYTRAATLIK
jgi:agmatine/peptidylarginine deiminase